MSDAAPVEEQPFEPDAPEVGAFVPWADYSKELTTESSVARRNLLRQKWLQEQGPNFVADYAGEEPTGVDKQTNAYRQWKARRDYAQTYLEKSVTARLPAAAIGKAPAVTGLGFVDSGIAAASDLVSGYVAGAKSAIVNAKQAAAALAGNTNEAARLGQVKQQIDKDFKTGRSPQSIEDERQQNEREAQVYAEAGVPRGQSEDLPVWARVKLGFDKATTNLGDSIAQSLGSTRGGPGAPAAPPAGAGLCATGGGGVVGVPLIAAGKVASVLGGGTASGLDASSQTFENIMQLSPAAISASPVFGKAYSRAYAAALTEAQDSGLGGREAVQAAEAKARAKVASEASVASGIVVGAAAAGLEAIGAKFGQGAIAGQVGKTVATATAKRAGISAASETIEEGPVTTGVSNAFSIGAGDTRGITRDVVESGIQGGVQSLGTSAGTIGAKSIYGSATSSNPAPAVPGGAAPAGAPATTPPVASSSGGPGPGATLSPTPGDEATGPVEPGSNPSAADAGPQPAAEANPTDGAVETPSRPVSAPIDGRPAEAPSASVEAPTDATSAAPPSVESGSVSDIAGGDLQAPGSGIAVEERGAVDATPRTDGASGQPGTDRARSAGIPERGMSTPLGEPDAAPTAAGPQGRVPGVASGADADKAVGRYNPTETGIFPGDEAPTRALGAIVGPVTVRKAEAEAARHYADYLKYANEVNSYFGEVSGYVIPRAQFVTELTDNILATAEQRGAPMTGPGAKLRASQRLEKVQADPDFTSTDRRVRGDRREIGGWVTPEARWQQPPEANVARLNDAIATMPGWRGEAVRSLVASGDLTVIPTAADIPGIKGAAQMALIKTSGGRIGGARLTTGKSYIVADQTGAEFLFARTLHEVGVHGGLQQMFSPAVMSAFATRIKALASYTSDPSARFGAGRAAEGDNEVVAHFIENMARREARGERLSSDSKLGKLWADIKAGINAALTKFFNRPAAEELTAKELYELALGALAARAATATNAGGTNPDPGTLPPAPKRRGRPAKPVDESVVGEATADNDITEAEIDVLSARTAVGVKPLPKVDLVPVSDALAAIAQRGNTEEIVLANRMAAVGDPMLNGVIRQMAKNPEKYQQYVDATDVRGVEFSLDYRDAALPLRKQTLGDRLSNASASVREALFDPAARAIDWMQENVPDAINDFRTAANVYRYMSDGAHKEFVETILKDIRAIARESGQTIDQVVVDIGHALTAFDVERVNGRLLASDAAEVAAGTMTQAKAAQRYAAVTAPDGALPPDTANGELGVAGGMSNPQATALMARVAAKYPNSKALVEAIQERVYDMNSAALVSAVEHGVHTPYTAAQFSNPQAQPLLERLKLPAVTDADRAAAAVAVRTTYVPMNSDAIEEQDQSSLGLGRPAGLVVQRAEGRSSLPLDGLNSSLRSADGVLRHIAYQPFKRALFRAWDAALQANNNDPKKAGDALGFSMEAANLPGLKGAVIYYRENGAQRVFHWNDPKVGAAITGANTDATSNIIGDAARYAVRKFSGLATVFNPFFAPPNAIKDIGEKLLRLGSANVKDVNGLPIRTTGDVAPHLAAVQYLPAATAATFRRFIGSGGAKTQADVYLEEFLANGGSSLFGDSLKNGNGAINAVAEQAKNGYSKPGALLNAVAHYNDNWNNSFENISALMAYTYFRDRNATPKAAAAGALELMNFGKRGTAVRTLSTITPFVGPVLIGAANLVNDALPRMVDKTDRATGSVVQRRSYAGAATLAGLTVGLTGVALAMAGGEGDDDPELGSKLLNAVPQTVLERSLPIKVGDAYVKAPIPFGAFMLAWGAAVEAAKYIRREAKAADLVKTGVIENAVKHLTPFKPPQFKFEDGPLEYLALSSAGILSPFVTMLSGATTFNPPRSTPQNKDKTAAEQASVTTAPEYVAVSKGIQDALGLDIRPATIKQFVDGYTPGLLGIAKRGLIDNPNKERQGKETTSPLLSPYVMDAENPYAVNTKLNEYVKDAQSTQRGGGVKDTAWLAKVKSQAGSALRARKGVKDFAVLKRLDAANEKEQRALIAEYKRNHNLGAQQ